MSNHSSLNEDTEALLLQSLVCLQKRAEFNKEDIESLAKDLASNWLKSDRGLRGKEFLTSEIKNVGNMAELLSKSEYKAQLKEVLRKMELNMSVNLTVIRTGITNRQFATLLNLMRRTNQDI